jgi:hypothetical protein
MGREGRGGEEEDGASALKDRERVRFEQLRRMVVVVERGVRSRIGF